VYKSKNVRQISALKTRDSTHTPVIIWSTTLRKLVADSQREMLAKRRQSRSMTVTVDDESAADAQMLTGKERHSSLFVGR